MISFHLKMILSFTFFPSSGFPVPGRVFSFEVVVAAAGACLCGVLNLAQGTGVKVKTTNKRLDTKDIVSLTTLLLDLCRPSLLSATTQPHLS